MRFPQGLSVHIDCLQELLSSRYHAISQRASYPPPGKKKRFFFCAGLCDGIISWVLFILCFIGWTQPALQRELSTGKITSLLSSN